MFAFVAAQAAMKVELIVSSQRLGLAGAWITRKPCKGDRKDIDLKRGRVSFRYPVLSGRVRLEWIRATTAFCHCRSNSKCYQRFLPHEARA